MELRSRFAMPAAALVALISGERVAEIPANAEPVPVPKASSQDPGGGNWPLASAQVGRLRNPFEWDHGGEKRGLLGWLGEQPSPQRLPSPGEGVSPGMPGRPMAVPPGTMPGAEGMPGGLTPGMGAGEGVAPGMEGAVSPPGTVPPGVAAESFAAAVGAAGPGFGGGLGGASEGFPMIGDRGPMFLRQNLRFPPIPPPLPPGTPRPGNDPALLTGRSVAAIVPAIRGFKIADNQYPRPVDRVFVYFNYYDGVNQGINDELRAPIRNMQVYTETFGLEKTFLDRQASVGFRIPLNTLTITSPFPGLGGTNTSTGNLNTFLKYALYDDPEGNLFSIGMDLTLPTGPRSFAGYPVILGINAVDIQPFFGYILNRDRLFLQGFNSIMVPTDSRLATMFYSDIGLGYYLFRAQDPRSLISFIAPAFETHLNIPLNYAGFRVEQIGSTPNVVNLTFGLSVGFGRRAVLSAAYVRPVTGPLPFTGEFALLLNVPFGGRVGPGPGVPLGAPIIGR
jgi:hypothetical protein